MSDPLLPCPFCRSRAMGPSPGNGETRDLWYISCTACQCEMSHGSGALVIGQWNRRAPTGAAPAEAYAWRAAGAMREAARYRWLRDRSGYDIRTLLGVGDFTTLDDFIDRAAAQTPAAPTGDSHE